MKKILIVDDEVEIAKMIAMGLDDEIFVALCATSGPEAIEKFDFGIDLIITDYRMPKMSGLELAKELKRKKSTLIILLHTGSQLSNDERVAAKAAGIDGFLQKPIRIDAIERIVCHLLRA